jgi:hypothetical protein
MKRLVVLVFSLIFIQPVFAQWQMLNSPNSPITDLEITNTNKILAASSNGLYFSTDDGSTWDSLFNSTPISKIEKDKLGNLYFMTIDYLYYSSDDGVTWTNRTPFQLSLDNFEINDNNNILIASNYFYKTILKSYNFGVTWDTIAVFNSLWGIDWFMGLNSIGEDTIFFSSYGRSFGGPISEFKYLWRTTNNGMSWYLINNGIYFANLYHLNDTIYLAAVNAGGYTNLNGVFMSYNLGDSLIRSIDGLNNKNIKNMVFTASNIFICQTGDGIYRTKKIDLYWQKLDTTGLNASSIYSIYYSDEGILYACTNNGIAMFVGELPVELTSFIASVNQNKVQLNWETATELNNNGFEVQRKLENSDWITISFVQGKGTTTEPTSYSYFDDVSEFISNKIYYRLKQIDYNGNYEFSDEVEVITLPLDYSLSQNYPNPFNPVTKIKYEVPENTNVTLEVFDVLGRLIKTLVNENKSAGRYEVEFNASELSSGLYFYKISAGGFEQTRKMLLLK